MAGFVPPTCANDQPVDKGRHQCTKMFGQAIQQPPGKDWQSGNNNNNMQQLHSLMPVP